MDKRIWRYLGSVLLLSTMALPIFAYSPYSRNNRVYFCQKTCPKGIQWMKDRSPRKIDRTEIIRKLTAKRNKKNRLEQTAALTTPDQVKGIYVTGYTFQNNRKMNEIINLIQTTELNAIVIDIQDDNGYWMFPPSEDILTNVSTSGYKLSHQNFQKKLAELQKKEIYTIARVVTFQSPEAKRYYPDLALKHKNGQIWQNWKGISWLDMTNKKSWNVPIAKAKAAIKVGFDEIQFDYIRFPSDGTLSNIAYHDLPTGTAKHEVMSDFFVFLNSQLDSLNIPISADIFGFTYIRSQANNDLNIGQRVIDFAPYFDHLSPMVYPSHYPDGFLGIDDPAANPYPIVNIASRDGNDLISRAENPRAQSRPWLQYFNLGARYDRAKIQAQIKAVEAYPNSGWIFWNPRNTYDADYFDADG